MQTSRFKKHQRVKRSVLSIALSALVSSAVLVSFTSTFALAAQQKPDSVTANDFINLFEKLSGSHPGFRKAHAKGVCAVATFVPNQDAKYFSSSELFKHESLPAQLRFSLGGGNPSADERVPGVRGLAIQIALPDGTKHTITGNSTPTFAGKDPETFFGLLQTFIPDESGKYDPAKTGAYIAAHPSTHANAKWSQITPAPASFAQTPYFGLHTFFYQDAASSEKIKYRWQLEPDLGVEGLSEAQRTEFPSEFLESRLSEQVKDPDTSVSFTLLTSIGQAQDTNVDPSQMWPEDREQVSWGQLIVSEVGGKACDMTNFDPNILSRGFTPSDDPVLRMRSPAYGISFGKRLSQQ